MIGIGAFQVLMRTRLNIKHYSPLKQTKVGFIFFKSSIRSRSCQSRYTSCRQRLGLRLGFKAGLKKLQPEPKLLNRGLRLQGKIDKSLS